MEIECCLFCQSVQYWEQDYSSAWTNQIADTLYVSDSLQYGQVVWALDYQSRGPGYKSTGYLHDWLFEGTGYLARVRTQCFKVTSLSWLCNLEVVAPHP